MSFVTAQSITSVILAHDSPLEGKLLLEALRRQADFRLEQCTAEAGDILQTVRQFKPEVILVAAYGTGQHVCDIVRTVRRKHSGCKMVVLIDGGQRSVIPELFRLGARGVVDIRTAEIESVLKGIVHVYEGHFWLSSKELDLVLEEFTKSCSVTLVNRNGRELLSPRELEVVTLLAEGLTNRDIASELKISPNTVRNYLSQIFDKIGVSTRTELVRFALAPSHSQREDTSRREPSKPIKSSERNFSTRLPRAL